MDNYDDSVMIALIPTTSDWCRIDLPHLTLVYAGKIDELKSTTHNDLAKTALNLAMTCSPVTLDVIGTDVFGEGEETVDVLRLDSSPEIMAMRSTVSHWNASEYLDYKPHVTIGPVGNLPEKIPKRITFDRVMVSWGDSQLTFRFYSN